MITLNYVKDESQQKTLKYTVEHKDRQHIKAQPDYTKDVWVNDPDRLTIQKRKPLILRQPENSGSPRLSSIDPATSEVGESRCTRIDDNAELCKG